MKTKTFQLTKNKFITSTGLVGCTRYGRNRDEYLICLPFVQYILGETPDKITVKVSTTRIHRKGCHKIERQNTCMYPFLDGVNLNKMSGGMCWHHELDRVIESLNLPNTFYIIIL